MRNDNSHASVKNFVDIPGQCHQMIFCLQNGITPVWLAAEKGNNSAVRLLMDKEADITIADKVTSLTNEHVHVHVITL